MLLNYKRKMPIKNNHINVNVKNVIKLDHNKKKTRRRRKNKNNKNIPIPLARPNNSVYNPNAITYQTGVGSSHPSIQGSIQYSTNKSTYDMKPRIGFGIDPNSDTTSTNMTQQLLLEHQKQNDDKTNERFLDYHTNFVNGMKLYHESYYEPLKSDFDRFTNTYPTIYQQQSPSSAEHYTNNLLINYDDNNVKKITPYLNKYKSAVNNTNNNRKIEHGYDEPEFNFDNIYNSKNADNFDDKEDYPILESNNADNFSPPPFDEFVSNAFNNTKLKNDIDNTNLNEAFDVESVDEDENDLPKNDAVLEEKTFAIYFSQIKDPKILNYLNKSDPRLKLIVPPGIGGGAFNLLLLNKLKQSTNTKIKGLKFNIPARFFTEEQIKKIKKK